MLKARLIELIRREGPLPFDEFMEHALYDPEDGFFTAGPLRSVKAGDFLTSPEVSPWFGRMMARFIASQSAGPGVVVDVGAGSGSLLASLMADLGDAYSYHAIEASRAAREALAEVLRDEWVHESVDALPARFLGFVVANELLDNLPVRLGVLRSSGWVERHVGEANGDLRLVDAPARPETIAWLTAFSGDVGEGSLVEVQLAAGELVSGLVGRIERGALLAIDYGDTADELVPRRSSGTLRTYRAHHLGPDPLLEPGATDITVDVNFSAMMDAARGAGAEVELMRQDEFLGGLGLADVVSGLRFQERELARDGHAMRRLLVRSELIDAQTLMHPRGLGDFRVMVARVG